MIGTTTWTITLLCLLLNINCYADRSNIGIVLLSLDYSDTMKGMVMSAFFYGYICTQILGGRSCLSRGPVVTLLIGVFFWCIFDALTVLVYEIPFLFIMCRVGMGLGEGVVYPSLHHIASRWFRKDHKTFLLMVVTAGMDLGTVMALLITPVIIAHFGWKYVFLFSSASNFLWMGLFSLFAADSPDKHNSISAAERQWIFAGRDRFVDSDQPIDRKSVV